VPASRHLWSPLLLVASAALGLAAFAYLRAMNHAEPPLALGPEARPITPVTAPPADRPRRVLWVVLDGLRLDTSRELPFLQELRAQGFDGIALAELPSLSRPSYTALASGAPPLRSGVRNNAFRGAAPVDTIFDRAQAAGLSAVGTANLPWWNGLFGRSFSRWVPLSRDAADDLPVLSEVLDLGAELTLVHLVDLDRVAHRRGARDDYRAKARELDDLVRKLAAKVDLAADALIVTSDHGHRDRGGHGGPEPEVVRVPLLLAGKGVRSSHGARESGSLARLAPTLALLLGTELPRDASAEPLLEALDTGVLGSLEPRLAEWRAHRAEYERRLGAARPEASLLSGLAPGLSAGALLLAGALGLCRPPRGKRGLVANPSIAVCVLLALGVADLPLSLSGVVTLPTLVLTLAAGVLLGVTAYLLCLARMLATLPPAERAPAWLWNFRVTALLHLALAPLLWALFGFDHATALPPPVALFLPLPAAFVGGSVALLLVAASLFVAWRGRALLRPRAEVVDEA
jgi:hypothetical protein